MARNVKLNLGLEHPNSNLVQKTGNLGLRMGKLKLQMEKLKQKIGKHTIIKSRAKRTSNSPKNIQTTLSLWTIFQPTRSLHTATCSPMGFMWNKFADILIEQ